MFIPGRSRISTSIFILLISTSLSVAQKTCEQPKAVTDVKFSPGQVWQYNTRPGEEGSTITVLRVEGTAKQGTVVHVRVDGIHFSNCTGDPAPETIEHMPFARAALDESVTKQVRTLTALPDFGDGYRNWLNACGESYTIPVNKVLDLDDLQFSRNLGCK